MNMMLLGDVLFGDEEALTIFMGEHEICHNGINQAVEDALGYSLQTYPLGDAFNDSDWLLNHYSLHMKLQTALGLTGLPDLSDVHFDDESEFSDWMQLHNYEHQKINLALNLT